MSDNLTLRSDERTNRTDESEPTDGSDETMVQTTKRLRICTISQPTHPMPPTGNKDRERYVVRAFQTIATTVVGIDLEAGKTPLPPFYLLKQWLLFLNTYFDVLVRSHAPEIGQVYTYINHVINSYCNAKHRISRSQYRHFIRELNDADEQAMQLGHRLIFGGFVIPPQLVHIGSPENKKVRCIQS